MFSSPVRDRLDLLRRTIWRALIVNTITHSHKVRKRSYALPAEAVGLTS